MKGAVPPTSGTMVECALCAPTLTALRALTRSYNTNQPIVCIPGASRAHSPLQGAKLYSTSAPDLRRCLYTLSNPSILCL